MSCLHHATLPAALAVVTLLGFASSARGGDTDPVPLRPGAADGWWQSAAGERKAAEVEFTCVRAAPAGALAIARELADADYEEAALHCLELSYARHPLERQLVFGRVRLLFKMGRREQGKTELAALGLNTAEMAAVLTDLEHPVVDSKLAGARAAHGSSRTATTEPSEGEARSEPPPAPQEPGATAPAEESKSEPKASEPETKAKEKTAGDHEEHNGDKESAEPIEHEEHEEQEKEEPQRIGGGLLRATKGDATLTDITAHGDHKWGEKRAGGTLHLLHRSGDDAASDDLLDGFYEAPLDTKSGFSALLGYSTGKGDVSYKTLFGGIYRRKLPHEREVSGELRHFSYSDGANWQLSAAGSTPVAPRFEASGRLDIAVGDHNGAGLRAELSYKLAHGEVAGFLAQGHGIASHLYLRPEDGEGYTTIGADYEREFAKIWLLTAGAEMRRQSSGTELELSVGIARSY